MMLKVSNIIRSVSFDPRIDGLPLHTLLEAILSETAEKLDALKAASQKRLRASTCGNQDTR